MKILLTTITLLVFSLAASNATSTASRVMSGAPTILSEPPAVAGGPAQPNVLPGINPQRPTRFSSAYTALTKCGSGMTRKEEKEAEEHGSDIPTLCKGVGGYDILVGYSACSSHFAAQKGEENIPLTTQTVDWKQKTVEWRLAHVNGKAKPFALILREYEYSGDQQCATGGKITGESLVVKGLKGYEHIDGTVKVKGTPNPNLKARQIADQGYAQK